jgi:hypothetical protein
MRKYTLSDLKERVRLMHTKGYKYNRSLHAYVKPNYTENGLNYSHAISEYMVKYESTDGLRWFIGHCQRKAERELKEYAEQSGA